MTTQQLTVLVTYASKMGGTEGIAKAIGVELARSGLDVQLRDAGDVTSVHGYDAAVVGSAIYASRWRPAAVQVLEQLAAKADEFTATPTWLFHSGPCGPAACTQQVVAPKRVRELAHRIGAAPPVTFGGRLEMATAQGFLARQMAKGKLAGDFRDFARITAWADTVAQQLTGSEQHPLPGQTLPAQRKSVLHAPDVFADQQSAPASA